ncbi:hypothetical protein ACEF14_03450 [Weissella paramesenteroides]
MGKVSLMNKGIFKGSMYYVVPALIFFGILFFISHNGFLYAGADLQFHANRIFEVHRNIQNNNLIPIISTYSDNQIGSIVMTMYPQLPVYIGALLQFVFQPVTAIYVLMWLQLMVQFSITTWVAQQLGMTQIQGMTSGLISTTATPLLSQIIQQQLLGEVWAMSFMPLVVLGLIRLARKDQLQSKILDLKSILLLIIGFSFILFSHVMSFVIVFAYTVLFAIYVLIFKKTRFQIMVNLIFSGILTIGLTAAFTLPFLSVMSQNKLGTPPATGLTLWAAPELLKITLDAVLPTFRTDTIGIIALVSLILTLLTWRKQTILTKRLTLIAVAIIFSGSYLLWYFIYNTPLGVIQFPHRVLAIAIFLLSLTFVMTVGTIVKSKKKQLLVYIGIIVVSVGFSMVSLKYGFLNNANKNAVEVNYNVSNKQPVNYSPMANFKVNNDEFINLMKFWNTYGAFDYIPVPFAFNADLQSRQVVQNKQMLKTNAISIPNGMIYKTKTTDKQNVTLPMLGYKSINYQVVDQHHHQLKTIINANEQIEILNPKHALTIIMVKAKMPIANIIGLMVSFITFTLLMVSAIFMKFKKFDNKVI